MAQEYNPSQIKVLQFPDFVRQRASLYVGEYEPALVPNVLLREALCCARDEAFQGRCSNVYVVLGNGGRASIKDDGPGLPLQMGPCGTRVAEHYLTSVHAGCAAGKSTEHIARTTCVLTLAVLNALSSELAVRIRAEGEEWSQEYIRGVATGPLQVTGHTNESGTELSFKLDESILQVHEFDASEFQDWVRQNVVGLHVSIQDQRGT